MSDYKPMTNLHFAEWCHKMLGQPYWYGTTAIKCTESLWSRKRAQYPTEYGNLRTPRYKDDIKRNLVCCDCIGASKGYAWTNGGEGVVESIGNTSVYKSYYATNGCPDYSANGMFEYAKKKGMKWGVINTIPEVVGVAVRFDGHVGYYMGNGKVIEWRGFNYGCVQTRLSERPWLHWYYLPFINYIEDGKLDIHEEEIPFCDKPTLRKGCKGADVVELQNCLIALGYKLPQYGADGDFGSETDLTVKAFQFNENLEVDGIVGRNTWSRIDALISGENKRFLTIVSGSWNVRNAPAGDSIGYCYGNERYEMTGSKSGVWIEIVYKGNHAWVAEKAVKIDA